MPEQQVTAIATQNEYDDYRAPNIIKVKGKSGVRVYQVVEAPRKLFWTWFNKLIAAREIPDVEKKVAEITKLQDELILLCIKKEKGEDIAADEFDNVGNSLYVSIFQRCQDQNGIGNEAVVAQGNSSGNAESNTGNSALPDNSTSPKAS